MMKQQASWLLSFLRSCVEAFSPQEARERWRKFSEGYPGLDMEERLRRWFDLRLRETGLVYGTPLASTETIGSYTVSGAVQQRAAFLAICWIEVQLALEMACALGHEVRGWRQVAELLIFFALLRRRLRLARRIDALCRAAGGECEPPPRLERLARKVERDLWKQAYLAGNPLLGLPLHNSLTYSDAKTFGRLAIAYYERGMQPEPLKRVWDFQERERLLLLQAMLDLTLADRNLGVASRQVIREQIRRARLGWRQRRKLLKLLRRPSGSLSLAAAVENARLREFLLEQVILGAMLDGHVSRAESDYIEQLAGWLGVPPAELAQLEMGVLAFYEQNRSYLDLFTVATAVQNVRQRWISRLEGALSLNLDRIVAEIKNTGALAELLMRAARGEKLSVAERRQMARRLVDILRAMPSLAIFALPGGAVLLPLLFRILPDELKPRSFVEKKG